MDESGVPFKSGQHVESRSFVTGYRGSWFRGTVRNIRLKKGEIMIALEHNDFPDEKIRWSKLYQKPYGGPKSQRIKKQIMVRPSFPPIFRESEIPDINNITEVVVIVSDEWKVGDLVDWWTDDCYWTAKLTEILGNGKARVEFPPPPVGEGSSYEIFCKDLRPTLEWSLDNGWTVPTSESGNICARLIMPVNPVNQEGTQNVTLTTLEVTEIAEPSGQSLENITSFSSHMSTSSLLSVYKSERQAKRPLSPAAFKETQTLETNMGSDGVGAGIGKSSYSDSVSSSHVRDAMVEMPGSDPGNKNCDDSGSSQKIGDYGNIPLNSSFSDTIEAAILDYEELLTRVKWIKGILRSGTTPSNTVQPTWKFLEHRPSSIPK